VAALVGGAGDALRTVLGLAGVQDVELVYPRRLHVFPPWLDERIAERAAAKGAPRA
jgi:hypothetical protein